MPDNTKIKGSQDRKRINIHESYEVEYWTKTFGVSPDELRVAVGVVGTSAEKVRKYLEKK